MLIVLPSGWDWKVMVLTVESGGGSDLLGVGGGEEGLHAVAHGEGFGGVGAGEDFFAIRRGGLGELGEFAEEGLQSGVDAGVVADLAHGVSVV